VKSSASADDDGSSSRTIEIERTDEHPFWVTNGENLESQAYRYVDGYLVPMRDLVAGRTASGTSPLAASAASNSGILSGGWITAGELLAGDRLVTSSGTTATVVGSTREDHVADGGVPVYNFEVEGTHMYAVTGGMWVHNRCHSIPVDTPANAVLLS
jgi:hypothetical protein